MKVPAITSQASVITCLHLSILAVFQSGKTTSSFKKRSVVRLWEIFLSCHASRGFAEKGIPQVFQLSFTIQPGFLLLPPHGTHTDKRQIKIGKQTSPGEGPPTPTRKCGGFENSWKAGWGFLLAHNVTGRLRKVSDLCRVSLPFGGGAGTRTQAA